MKIVVAGMLGLCLAGSAMAQTSSNIVRWRGIEGVITALGVDNPVCGTDAQGNCVGDTVHSGTFAWTARAGNAMVNLATGAASFQVQGLVINGSLFSGTAGPITQVEGTLVCDAGQPGQDEFDTAPVALSQRGDAAFTGRIQGIPRSCSNPLFLIRIAQPSVALGRWIATGTERVRPTSASRFADED